MLCLTNFVAQCETLASTTAGYAGTVIVAALAIFAVLFGVRVVLRAVRTAA